MGDFRTGGGCHQRGNAGIAEQIEDLQRPPAASCCSFTHRQ